MGGIEVQGSGEEGVLVELRGEFDQHNLEELRETLGEIVALRRPTVLALSGVAFLDIGATRELALLSRLYAHHLILSNPSWQVLRSVAACGLEEWFDFQDDTEDPPRRPAGVRPARSGGARGCRAA